MNIIRSNRNVVNYVKPSDRTIQLSLNSIEYREKFNIDSTKSGHRYAARHEFFNDKLSLMNLGMQIRPRHIRGIVSAIQVGIGAYMINNEDSKNTEFQIKSD